MQPKASVIIPVYNVENYLDRCVESVVKQTYENIEIILVDDGSTDQSPKICDDLAKKDGRIRVIHKANAGAGMARNTGIENADGDYIFFFDSDDYVDPTVVQKCMDSVAKHNSDVVIFRYIEKFEDGREKQQTPKFFIEVFEGEQIKNSLLPSMYTYDMGFGIGPCGKMYKLSAIKDNGISFVSEREVNSEDAFFALEFYPKINKASVVNEALYYYCKRDDSFSSAYKKERQSQNDRFVQKSIEHIDKNGLPDCIKHHLMARYHMYTLAALKQLSNSNLSKKEKKDGLLEIFKSDVLHTTLKYSVLKLHKKTLFLFFMSLKFKCYFLCELLLKLKMKK